MSSAFPCKASSLKRRQRHQRNGVDDNGLVVTIFTLSPRPDQMLNKSQSAVAFRSNTLNLVAPVHVARSRAARGTEPPFRWWYSS